MKSYDIAVIGAGPSGCMAAIKAAGLGKKTVLIERNDCPGKKILLTGKGRCNITNTAPLDVFLKKFNPGGEFFRTAFFVFSSEDLINFFVSKGLKLKAERQGRVFPEDDKAASVVNVLEKCLKESGVEMLYSRRISGVKRETNRFIISSDDGSDVEASKVIIATGGASYKATGSSGDGFEIAKGFGHKVTSLKPALVPLRTKEPWVKDLQGLALENIRVIFHCGNKKIKSDVGELMFTHFGVSGPLVLDLSGDIVSYLDKYNEIKMEIDLKPGLKKEQVESKLLNKLAFKGNIQIKNFMQDILPKRLIPVFLSILNIIPEKRTNQITKEERSAMIGTLKAFPLTITGSLPIEEAMVTAGGVSKAELNPRTMESKLISGLYFAGEIIEGAAPSGGYNLQQAFSTGYLAGKEAAHT